MKLKKKLVGVRKLEPTGTNLRVPTRSPKPTGTNVLAQGRSPEANEKILQIFMGFVRNPRTNYFKKIYLELNTSRYQKIKFVGR